MVVASVEVFEVSLTYSPCAHHHYNGHLSRNIGWNSKRDRAGARHRRAPPTLRFHASSATLTMAFINKTDTCWYSLLRVPNSIPSRFFLKLPPLSAIHAHLEPGVTESRSRVSSCDCVGILTTTGVKKRECSGSSSSVVSKVATAASSRFLLATYNT